MSRIHFINAALILVWFIYLFIHFVMNTYHSNVLRLVRQAVIHLTLVLGLLMHELEIKATKSTESDEMTLMVFINGLVVVIVGNWKVGR